MKSNVDQLHHEALVADMHCDTVLMMRRGLDLSRYNSVGHVDIPRLIKGGINLQIFACCLDPRTPKGKRFERVEQLLQTVRSEITRNGDRIALAGNAAEAKRIIQSGRIAVVLAVENGMAIENDLGNLERLHALGVRYMTLTHTSSHEWCISCEDNEPAFDGLTDFGREVIAEMNRLGIMVDVSHISVRAFEEVVRASKQPVIASHSCALAICSHQRNLSDEQLRALADNGGMTGINFCGDFLSEDCRRRSEEFLGEHVKEAWDMSSLYMSEDDGEVYERKMAEYAPVLKGWEKAIAEVRPSVGTVVDHIDHVVDLIGADHVGLGSDFDGITFTPQGLADCSEIPNITRELIVRGYSENDIKKILGGNFIRVFEQVCGR